MKAHCYGNLYNLYGKNGVLKLNEYQFEILKLFIKEQKIDNVLNILLGSQETSPNEYFEIKENISTLINGVVENAGEIESIELTGELNKFYPRVLNLELTSFCNFKCGHCYKEADKTSKDFLSLGIIEEMTKKYKGKVQLFHLTGGEPFSHPLINKIIDNIVDNGYLVNITTNGSLHMRISDEMLKKINNIQISIYGYDDLTYYASSNYRYSTCVFDFARRLEKLDISYDVSFLANKLYLKHSQHYNDLLNSLNCNNILCGFADLQGRNNINSIWHLDEQEKNTCLRLFKNIKKYAELDENFDEEQTKCDACTMSYCINEKGLLYPCQVLNDDSFCLGDYKTLENFVQKNDNDIIDIVNANMVKVGNMCKFKK